MKIYVLASGSKGNSTYLEIGNHKILIDMGKNRKYIVDKLKELDVDPKDIEYVFISHTHDDHISALPIFIKKYKPTIVISKPMLDELECLRDYPNILIYEDKLDFNDFKVDCIHSSHDATDSRNFIFKTKDHSLAYVTDTGYINNKNFKYLKNIETYLFESNHDIEMLSKGPYPPYLKTRILSDEGHLSNHLSGVYLTKLIGNNTKNIVLMHLSETNNTEDLALNEIKHVFDDYGIEFSNIKCAKQDEICEVINND